MRKELERKEQEGEKETGLGREYEEVMEESDSNVSITLHQDKLEIAVCSLQPKTVINVS